MRRALLLLRARAFAGFRTNIRAGAANLRCREVKGGKLGLARGSEAPHTFFAVGFRAAAAQRSVHRPCRPRRRGSHRHGRAHLDCSRWASPRACIRRVRPGVEPGHIQSDHQHSFRPIASTRLTSCLELSTPRSQSSRRCASRQAGQGRHTHRA